MNRNQGLFGTIMVTVWWDIVFFNQILDYFFRPQACLMRHDVACLMRHGVKDYTYCMADYWKNTKMTICVKQVI